MSFIYQQYGVQPNDVTGSVTRTVWGNNTGQHSVQKPTVGPYNLGGYGPQSYPTDWLQNYWQQMGQQMTHGRVRPQAPFTQGGVAGLAGGAGGRRWQAGGVTQNAFATPSGSAPRFGGGSMFGAQQPLIPGNTGVPASKSPQPTYRTDPNWINQQNGYGVPPSTGLATPDNDKGAPTRLYGPQVNTPQINGGGAAGSGWYPSGANKSPPVPQINGGGAAGMGWYPSTMTPRSGGGGTPFTNPMRPSRQVRY